MNMYIAGALSGDWEAHTRISITHDQGQGKDHDAKNECHGHYDLKSESWNKARKEGLWRRERKESKELQKTTRQLRSNAEVCEKVVHTALGKTMPSYPNARNGA